MTVPAIGHGTAFKRGDAASPEVFTTIAMVLDVDLGTEKLDTKERSHQDDVDNAKHFVAGLIDGGEPSFEIEFTDGTTGYTQLKSDLNGRALHNYQIVLPTTISATKKFSFTAYVAELSPKIPNQDVVKCGVKLRIDGLVTFA